MEQSIPVDVISVCSADGSIRPLRFQMEDENHQLLRVNIDKIISSKQTEYIGMEGYLFRCNATVWGKTWLFELRYVIRSHSWNLVRRLH